MAERTSDVNDMQEQEQSGEQAEASDGGANAADAAPTGQRVADLESQLAAARAEATQNWDRFLRERAEMDNFRKRQERIYADRVQREKRELLGKVLDVVDNLDRALRYQDTMDRESLQQGLRMLQWQLNELLKGEGLSPVPTVGQPFDPYVHEAIESVASDEHPEGVVVEEVRRGYKMGDETLRPARVKVSSGADAEGSNASNDE
ncbi:MAG TPA: nucleotide exchange factor GrpE [Ktedonobacterales bacterium]|nr:nucleotide exchange factor GrpE [Ktedonobacterales bacterium]